MKRLLLIGAGHAHLHVLRALAARPLPDTQVTLVSPYPAQVYSGMLPGWIAGAYRVDDFAIPIAPLAAAADAVFVPAAVAALDLAARTATTGDGDTLGFDVVSLDIGPVLPDALPGLREHALGIRPINAFVDAWPAQFERLARVARDAARPARLAVVGGGAGGVELTLAIAARARNDGVPLQVMLVTGRDGLLPGLSAAARARLARPLRHAGVGVFGTDATAIVADAVHLAGGTRLTDLAIAATGAAPAAWPREAGLAVDAAGFIAVEPTLRSTSHAFVFAAGDCASVVGHPRAKSGVYAVRAGPPLAANLYRTLTGGALLRWRPQRRALYLLSTGDRRAVGVYGGLAFEGAALWRWKDRIDRRFVARYLTRYDRC
jgi:selenide,water dikinase